MLFANTKSDIGNRYRKTSIGKYRDWIGSNMKISESDRELKNKIGTSLTKTTALIIEAKNEQCARGQSAYLSFERTVVHGHRYGQDRDRLN